MSMETINESIHVCKYLGNEKKQKILEGEMVLPDIKPDILSIIRMKGKVCIRTITAEENKIIVEGTTYFNAIYIADDEMNSQRSVNYEMEFSESIPFQGADSNSIVRLKFETGSIEYKVMNGRKIAIKVPIIFHVKVFNNCDISIVKGITDDEEMEVQKQKRKICSTFTTGSTQIELKENVQLDDACPPIGEILDCDVSITNLEYKLSYNKILAKADAIVKIVYSADTEDQNVESFETTLPLTGIIDMDGIDENQKIKLDFLLKSFWVRPVYQDMQANSISVEIVADVYAYVCNDDEMEFITDFYTPSAILKTQMETNHVLKNMIDQEDEIELSQTLVVPELSNTKILNISGDVTLNEKNVLNGKLAITGVVNVYVLYLKVTNHLMESKKLELPFQHVIKIDGLAQNMEPLIHLEVENIEHALAGENQLQVNMKLLASVLADEEEEINSISNLEISDEVLPIMPSMVIYYVKPGDTLWKIAKSFRNKVEAIKEFNDLKEDTIYPGQRLLIPRYAPSLTNVSMM